MNESAKDRYEIRIDGAGLGRRVKGWLALIVGNLLSQGHGPTNPGTRTFVIVDRSTGAESASHNEPVYDDGADLLGSLTADLESMSAHEFEATWIKLQA